MTGKLFDVAWLRHKKTRISGLFYRLGAAAPLRILFCPLTVWSVSC